MYDGGKLIAVTLVPCLLCGAVHVPGPDSKACVTYGLECREQFDLESQGGNNRPARPRLVVATTSASSAVDVPFVAFRGPGLF